MPEMPEDADYAFGAAYEYYEGDNIDPFAYLGSQVVAGMNYAYLCTCETSSTGMAVAFVYKDLQGNAEITRVTEFDLSDYAGVDKEVNAEQLAGGWTVYSEGEAAAIPSKVADAFSAAMEGLDGVSYKPVAYLGSQVVAGSNYAVLCVATPVTADPVPYLAVVTVYDGVDGTRSIVSIAGMNIADYNV